MTMRSGVDNRPNLAGLRHCMAVGMLCLALSSGCMPFSSVSTTAAGAPEVARPPHVAPVELAPLPSDEWQSQVASPPRNETTIWTWGFTGVGVPGRAYPLPDRLPAPVAVSRVAAGIVHTVALGED